MFYNKGKKKYSAQMFLKMLFEEDMYKYAIITVFYLGFLNCCETPRQSNRGSIELQERKEEEDEKDNFLDPFKQNDISINENLIKEENQEENLIKKEENQEENLIKEERCSYCHKIMKKKYICFGKEFPCCCLICLLGSLAGSVIGISTYFLINKLNSNNSSEDEEEKSYAKEQECFYSSFPGEDLYSVTQKLKEMGLTLYKDYSFCRQFDPNFYVFQINKKENFNVEKNKEELSLLKNISKNIKKEIFSNPEYYKKILFLGTEKNYINDLKKNGFSDIDIKDLLLEQFYEKLLENEEHFISCKNPQIFFNIFRPILGNFIFDIKCVQVGSSEMTSLESLFENYTNIRSVDLSLFDLSKVKTVKKCFYGCHNLTNLNLPSCVLMECKDISSIFRGCKSLSKESWEKFFNLYIPKLKNLSFAFAESNFDDFSFTLFNKNNFFVNSTANKTVTDYILENNHTKINYPNTKSTILGNKETINFTSLFEKCEKLRNVNNFAFLENCKNEVILDNMFKNCSNLLNVNFSAFNNNISSINGIFSDCINLQKISAQYWSEHFFEKTEHKGIINDTPLLSTVCIPEGKNIEAILFEKWGKISYKEGCYIDPICFSETCESEAILMIKNNLKKAGKNFCGNEYLDYIKCDVDNCVIYIEPVGLPFAFKGVSNMKTLKISNGLIPTSDLSYMFQNCKDLVSISLENIDTLLVTDISGMFYNCSSLKNIDSFVKNINVTNVSKMDYFFNGCSNLENVNLENWNLNLIVSMSHFFDNCKNLISVILPNFGEKLEDLSFMFSECKKLKKIFSLDKFNPINVKNTANMFYGCSSLITLDLTAFGGENVKNINEMFANCNNLTTINAPKLAFNNVTEYNNCFSCDTSLTKVCSPQNDKISTLLSNLWGDNVLYVNECYNNYQDQCTLSDLKLELTNRFDNLELVENKDYFWSDLSSEDEFIVMELNDSCFLSVKNLHVHSQSIFSMINNLKKVVFLKDNTKKTTTFQDLFKDCENLQSVSFNNIETQNIADMSNVFKNCRSLTYLDLSNFDTKNVITMEGMFSGCSSLIEIKFGDTFVTSKVINMQAMFYGCSTLTNINFNDKFDTSLVLTMEGMFAYCSSLENLDLSVFNTNSVLKTNGMFRDCKGLISIKFGDKSVFDKVKEMSYMFFQCVKLEKLDLSNFNTKNVENMESMFNNCKSLNSITFGNNFDTSQVTDMNYLFFQCVKIPYLDLSNFNTKNVKNMKSMFDNCKSLKTIKFGDNFVAQNLNNMIEMFTACPNLEEINIPNFNNTQVTSMDNCFFGCTNLKSINIPLMSLEKVNSYDNFFSSTMKNLKKVCCKDDPKIRKILYDLWGENQTVFIDGCFLNIIDQCTAKDIREELESKFQEFGFQEKVDYFWDDLSSENGFIVMKLNNSCFLSVKTLYVKDQSILANLVNLREIVFLKSNTKITTLKNLFYNCWYLKSVDFGDLDTQYVTNLEGLFYSCLNLEIINFSNFNTQNVNNMYCMFYGCSSLKELDLKNFNTANVTNMWSMFSGCSSLTELDISNFNTANVTNMWSMFSGCSSLTELDLENFNTSKVTNMGCMFYFCSSLTKLNLKNFNTENVVYMYSMFSECKGLTKLKFGKDFNTSNVSDMKYMFYDCSSLTDLDLSNFNTPNLKDMKYMFSNCKSLNSISFGNNFDTSQVTDMNNAFSLCTSLVNVKLNHFNTAKVTDMRAMFSGCSNLASISISNLNINPSCSYDNLFQDCSSLKTICTAENLVLKNYLQTLWLQTPIFVENCYHKSSDYVCPYSDAKEELNNKMQELGLVENNDYFWYSKEGDFDFFVMQINDEKCFFSCKNLFVNGESIFKELVKLKNIKIIQNGRNKVETARSMFENCRNLVDINLSGIDFQNAVSAEGMFRNCNNLVKIDLGEFNTKKVESFASMFEGCENLISLNFEKIITEKCKSFRNMFLKCKLLKSINLTLFDTRLAEDMSGMFDICGSLERLDLSSFNTPNLTDMRSMFKDCHSLKEILWNKNFNTSKVTNMLYLFYNCESLEYVTLSFFNTQQVMLFGGMFINCKKIKDLDLSSFDTSNGTNMSFMFYGCSSLTSLNLTNFKVNNVVTMNSMFAGCSILKTLDLWNNSETSNLKDMSYLFFGCNSLNYINLKSFHTTNVTKMDKAFYNCESLVFLDLNNFSSQSLVTADYLFAKCWSLQEIYASNTFNIDTNVSTAGFFEEDFNLRKICMNLNSDMLANLQSVIGSVTLNNGCYIRNNAFYFFYKGNDPINISTNKNITDYNNSFSSNSNFLKLK